MAQRLATEYVKTCLRLSEAEMSKFLQLFNEYDLTLQVEVLDNGNHEIVLMDNTEHVITLNFNRLENQFVCEASCYRLTDINLINTLRKAVALFKGDAIVRRIYDHFTIVYYYEHGLIVKIVEHSGDVEKLVYERKNSVAALKRLYLNNQVEIEIANVLNQVDRLLDLRNSLTDELKVKDVDGQLAHLSKQLFIMEA